MPELSYSHSTVLFDKVSFCSDYDTEIFQEYDKLGNLRKGFRYII